MKGEYGQSEHGNFKVIDTIGVPHPYCITERHVRIAADKFHGVLSDEAIRAVEKGVAKCGVKGCNLSYDEHETALLIECRQDIQDNDELHQYLLAVKDEAEANHYAGFAFLDKREDSG